MCAAKIDVLDDIVEEEDVEASDCEDCQAVPPAPGTQEGDVQCLSLLREEVKQRSEILELEASMLQQAPAEASSTKLPMTEPSETGPCTLEDILRHHSLQHFTELAACRRVRSMAGSIRELVARVRVEEGILSANQVCQGAKPLTEHAKMLQALSKAQQSFGLVANRQSRATAWTSFSKLVAENATSIVQQSHGDAQTAEVAQPICWFQPAHVTNDQGERRYTSC